MKVSKKYQHPFHEEIHGYFTWCLHCECAYKTKLWVKNNWECPDKKCNGNALDAFSWTKDFWPRSVRPEYPEIPEEGEYYPLYQRDLSK